MGTSFLENWAYSFSVDYQAIYDAINVLDQQREYALADALFRKLEDMRRDLTEERRAYLESEDGYGGFDWIENKDRLFRK